MCLLVTSLSEFGGLSQVCFPWCGEGFPTGPREDQFVPVCKNSCIIS